MRAEPRGEEVHTSQPSGIRDRSGVLRRALAPLLLAAAVLAAHAPGLRGPFVLDDPIYIGLNPAVQAGLGADWPKFFTDHTTYSAVAETPHYRPLVALSYAADAGRGAGTFAFKLTQLLLHLATVLALWWTLATVDRRYVPLPAGSALVAALWFAATPFNVEAVHYLSARSALMCGMFVVLALGLYARMWTARGPWRRAGLYGLHLAAVAAALLSKETALALPAAVLAFDRLVLCRSPRRARRGWAFAWPYLPYAAGLVAALAYMPNVDRAFDYLGQVLASPWRLPTAIDCLVENLRLMLLPAGLTVLHPIDEAARLASPRTLISLALVLGLLGTAWALRRRAPAVAFGTVWYFLLILPSTFVHLNFVLMENRGYAAGAGVAMVVGILATGAWQAAARAPAWRRPGLAAAAAVVAVCAVAVTWHQERVWGSEAALWRQAVRHNPDAPLPYSYLGTATLRQGRAEAADAAFRRALALDPEPEVARLARQGRAVVETLRHDYRAAARILSPLLRGQPDNPELLALLALTRMGSGDDTGLVAALRRLIEAERANRASHKYLYRYVPGKWPEVMVHAALAARDLPQAHWALARLREALPGSAAAARLARRVAAAAGGGLAWAGPPPAPPTALLPPGLPPPAAP